ncbi:glycoside hydrolase family 37 protein [Daldinia decipiens]|uniref:glycoside hydrolase family 37 protein n=1 Tax=Daldinia decipiens TaxID=326647 RepID=UPI0020C310DD|nr:glycoside hydrolase family 37 protein [Daldinia decipiens]KAI1657822.1 glycoside hydrolase family 37 protein [Daldinia decipiens]
MTGLRRLTAVLAFVLSPIVSSLYQNGSSFAACDSPLYCQGDVLKQIELAQPFSDSKTFVDLPTKAPLDEVLAAFDKLAKPLSNNTELNDFLSTYFGQAGTELAQVPRDQLETNPAFLDDIEDSVVKQFVEKVIDIWPDLTRTYVGTSNCTGCVDSFIPINRTFVVAGGRFREPYYWDSFWILEGLLRTGGSFTQVSRNIIENFLDFVEQFGFVPNGARIYYLNRSQPPLLTQMVKTYIDYTNDTSLLERALPLLIKEHNFWIENRTLAITSGGDTFHLAHYEVQNTEPRPESYREDYITANNRSYYAASGIIYPESHPLNDSEKAELYSNLGAGAESGWDYNTRFIANPSDAARDVYFPLRSLNTNNIVAVDLNSILYANEMVISDYLDKSGDSTLATEFEQLAKNRSEAMYALMWNDKYMSYFDYNLTSGAQDLYVPSDADTTSAQKADAPEGYQVFFHGAQFYPFWLGAAPPPLRDNPLAVKLAFERVSDLVSEKAGGIAATNYRTGQQWDQPNVWPPLMYVLMKGLLKTPATFGKEDPAYLETQDLSLKLAQRYLDSTFCTWRATGGSTDETPKLEGLGPENVGIMFEKYADDSTNVAGGGGEYEVVEGFGWTNGVLIWAVDTFGNKLKRPDCGNLTAADVDRKLRKRDSFGQRAVELSSYDARWIANPGRAR